MSSVGVFLSAVCLHGFGGNTMFIYWLSYSTTPVIKEKILSHLPKDVDFRQTCRPSVTVGGQEETG